MKRALVAGCCLALLATPAHALDSGWQQAGHVQAKLVSAVNGAGQGAVIDAALQLRPEAGWRIAWPVPAPDFMASTNVGNVLPAWPAPARYSSGGQQSFGYDGPVTLPLLVTLKTPGQAVMLHAAATLQVCKDSCASQTLSLNLPIPAGPEKPAAEASAIAAAKAALPATTDTPNLHIDAGIVGPDALVLRAYSQLGWAGADVFVAPASLHLTAAPQVTPDAGDPRGAMLRIAKGEGTANLARDAAGKTVTVILVTKSGALEKSFPF